MAKYYKVIFLLIFSLLLIGCSNEVKNNSDSLKFKQEYESFNDKVVNDIKYHNVTINENNPVIYSTYEEIFSVLESGSGIIFFGSPECQWCRSMIKVLLDALDSVGVEKLYYMNNMNDRNILSLSSDGTVTIEKEADPNYLKLLELLGDKASVYKELNDETIKRLYYPSVVFVKDGKIIEIVIGTVSSHNDPNLELNYEQKEELGSLYINYASIVMELVCTDIC